MYTIMVGCVYPLQYCKNTANVTTVTNDLIEMREKVFDLLKETPFRVVIFNEVSLSLNMVLLMYSINFVCKYRV